MKDYTMKKDTVFGDEIYRGEYGAAKVVKQGGFWSLYCFEPSELKTNDRSDYKTRKAAREFAVEWVTKGWF